MSISCAECKYNNTIKCTGACDTLIRWKKNPEEVERKIVSENLPAGVYWVSLDVRRDDVCAQDCVDLSRSIKVRSDRTMASIDDELREKWLPGGYVWSGGSRIGTAGDYVKNSEYKHGYLNYSHR